MKKQAHKRSQDSLAPEELARIQRELFDRVRSLLLMSICEYRLMPNVPSHGKHSKTQQHS